MKQIPRPANGHHYTSREIMEILDHAKALGVTFLKVDGFEAVWEIDRGDNPAPPAPRSHEAHVQNPRHNGNGRCGVCGDDLIRGNWGQPYCGSCYKRKKERDGQRR